MIESIRKMWKIEEIRKKIDRMHMLNLHKLQLMPSFALAEGEQEAN